MSSLCLVLSMLFVFVRWVLSSSCIRAVEFNRGACE